MEKSYDSKTVTICQYIKTKIMKGSGSSVPEAHESSENARECVLLRVIS